MPFVINVIHQKGAVNLYRSLRKSLKVSKETGFGSINYHWMNAPGYTIQDPFHDNDSLFLLLNTQLRQAKKNWQHHQVMEIRWIWAFHPQLAPGM